MSIKKISHLKEKKRKEENQKSKPFTELENLKVQGPEIDAGDKARRFAIEEKKHGNQEEEEESEEGEECRYPAS